MHRNTLGVYLFAKTVQLFLTPIAKISLKGKKVWLVSERGYDARDNGYHMFKYLRKEHPEINAWYLITRDSHDLDKVADLGNIVYKRTLKYWMLYISSSVLLVAFDPIVPSANKRFAKDIKNKNHQKTVFLQHGISGNNVTWYHKERAQFDMFICGAKPEADYVAENFHYRDGEVRYTGLARFDALHDIKPKRTILIMPTWRIWLKNSGAEEAAQSEYVKKWNSLINNPMLAEISERYNAEIIFYPHEMMQKNIGQFSSPNKNIIIGSHKEYDVQTLLKECSLLITDYSSVHFDFAYMNKPVLYYQFDAERFFKEHQPSGWFDYNDAGFGECVDDENALLECIGDYAGNDFRMKPEFEENLKEVFPLHDDHNCERIYQEIVKTFDNDELF